MGLLQNPSYVMAGLARDPINRNDRGLRVNPAMTKRCFATALLQ